jgi:ComF family protein
MLVSTLRAAASFVARSVFPHFCVSCGGEGTVLCDDCASDMEMLGDGIFVLPEDGVSQSVESLSCALPYVQPAPRALLQLYKYERVDEAGAAVAEAFGRFLRRNEIRFCALAKDAIVIPVPMHPWKEAWRGFNQADTLAAVFALETGARLVRGVLRRRFRATAQVGMKDREARGRNAEGSVRMARRFPTGMRFVLVDDVYTTGATINACAKELKLAGAGEVHAVTFLRG